MTSLVIGTLCGLTIALATMLAFSTRRLGQLVQLQQELVTTFKAVFTNASGNAESNDEDETENIIQPYMLFFNMEELPTQEDLSPEILEWIENFDEGAEIDLSDDEDLDDEDDEVGFDALPQEIKIKLVRFQNVIDNLEAHASKTKSAPNPEDN